MCTSHSDHFSTSAGAHCRHLNKMVMVCFEDLLLCLMSWQPSPRRSWYHTLETMSLKISLLISVPHPPVVWKKQARKSPGGTLQDEFLNSFSCSKRTIFHSRRNTKHTACFPAFFKLFFFFWKKERFSNIFCAHMMLPVFPTMCCDSHRSETRSSTSISSPETCFYSQKQSL